RERPGVVGVQDRGGRHGAQPLGDRRERLIPGDGLQPAFALRTDPPQRLRETRLGIAPGAVVADRALAAEPAACPWVVAVAAHVGDHAVPFDADAPARVVATPT